MLKNYTRKGYRVIAAAYRPLSPNINYTKMQRLSREEVETDLIFLGLIVLENKLKPETTPVISKLRDANIRIVIVTGLLFIFNNNYRAKKRREYRPNRTGFQNRNKM